jgi:hypothetical protein
MVVILLRNNGAYMEAARIGEEILADLQKSDRTPTPEKIQELEYMKLFLEKKREDLKSASVTTSPQKCSEE